MDCPNKEANQQTCPCTWPGCRVKGTCCECIRKHLKKRALPGCCFPKDAEATFDRSFEHFARLVQSGKI